ncbi:hypothetical protein TanjilG_11990 [Lupinus angustifolius]|nr:hypothetical protein TanjilG_11990 [Lupinus angustifolius]
MDCDDSINNPLLYLDPLCSALNMLADVASGLHHQDTTSSTPSLKIRFNMKTKTVKESPNDGSEEASNSNKPINFMASSFEEGTSSKAELNYKDDEEDIPIKEMKRRAMKGKNEAIINGTENADVIDQDWVPVKPPPNKSAASSSKKRQRFNLVVVAAPSELPQEFIDKINEMGGNETTLLITKSLFDSDLNEQQNRLSIPSKQIKNENFVREGELDDLEGGKCIEVKLIQPSLEVTNLTLAKWNMRKNDGKVSSSYVLRSSSWKKVIKANQLKVNDRIQVWSFRIQEELCMAIVKV